ncbi:carboxylesterase [Kribbella sp. VKM Ac-2527]|uniref:Carboxylesterase n=1 Tax=Kribbella caucasensis TaxID=2512215 RepID=A0A4R6KIS2_9ACTN|nr:alpha/beta fold hydrolase [Kribbella sp. VKM Ac-2527]TDO49781.1 carboxylesterase [Kribbella sp. VKM Ac-2527]
MPVQAHAEEFRSPGHGPEAATGVLLSHGFTGSPKAMRPFAEHLTAEGFGVAVPRLPGHGTHWREANKTTWQDWYAVLDNELERLRKEHDQVFLAGLSMGGCLVLRMAEEHGADVSGVVLVNPSVQTDDKRLAVLPVLQRVLPSFPGIANDIKKPGVDEGAYDRMPLRALYQLSLLWKITRDDLAKVTQPLLMFRSTVDHVVEPSSGRTVLARISSRDVTETLLEDSYHVATLDNDAPRIFADSTAFIRRITADA